MLNPRCGAGGGNVCSVGGWSCSVVTVAVQQDARSWSATLHPQYVPLCHNPCDQWEVGS